MDYTNCSDISMRLTEGYSADVHSFCALVTCVFGSVSSVLCIVVLTRRSMASSSTNTILLGLAISDMAAMLSYGPLAAFAVAGEKQLYISYGVSKAYYQTVYWIFHQSFFKPMHATSAWLTVTLAIWRYLVVCWPYQSKDWCSKGRARLAMVSVYVCVILMHSPQHIRFKAVSDGPYYYGASWNPVSLDIEASYAARQWTFSVLINMIPCLSLICLTLRLVLALVEAKRRRRYLTNTQGPSQFDRQMDRTNRMVTAVLFLFVVTEVPRAILLLMWVTHRRSINFNCYLFLQNIVDLIIMLNSAVNFLLYCTMSREFRRTFKELFLLKEPCWTRQQCIFWSRPRRKEEVIETGSDGTHSETPDNSSRVSPSTCDTSDFQV